MKLAGLAVILDRLEAHYGKPTPPKLTNPWHQVLWENVAYLADDKHRDKAFATLKRRIGLKASDILGASQADLLEVTKHGILADKFAAKLRECAQIAVNEFQSDLKSSLKLPLPKAKAAFKKFPGIGDPGAEKILLYARAHFVFPMDSNGLRVLVRLGFGEEKKNYAATYKSVHDAVQPDLQLDFDWLIRAHQLLRQHGQDLCKRNDPLCESCPLLNICPTGQAKN